MRPLHWLLAIAGIGLFGIRLVQDGMFVDGLWYAAIANNLAQGIGTFWEPSFTEKFYPVFHEHPPLVFGLESVFFRVLGSAWWVERLYCALVIGASVLLQRALWRRLFVADPSLQRWWPLSVLCWMLGEDCYLSYTGNMLECTLTLCTLGAVLALLRGGKNLWWSTLLGGLLCVAAFLCKGPAGLYPLAFFGVHWWVFRPTTWSKAVVQTALLTSVVAAGLGLLWCYPPAANSLTAYFEQQVWAALRGERHENLAPHRFYMVQRFLETHFHLVLVATALWFWGVKKRSAKQPLLAQQVSGFGALLGAAALLPILVSTKQAPHYIVPSLPWFALAIGALAAPGLQQLTTHRRAPQWLTPVLAAVAASLLVYAGTQWGHTLRRDRAVLGDVRQMLQVVPAHSVVGWRGESGDYSTPGFFQRYGYVALDGFECGNHPFLVVEKSQSWPAETDPSAFEKVDLPTVRFALFRKKNQ